MIGLLCTVIITLKSHMHLNKLQETKSSLSYNHTFTLMYFLSKILDVSQCLNELKKSTITNQDLICVYIHQGTPCIRRSLRWILNNAQRWACVEGHSLLNVNKTAGSMFWCYYWICSYLVNSSKIWKSSRSLERCDCRLQYLSALKEMIWFFELLYIYTMYIQTHNGTLIVNGNTLHKPCMNTELWSVSLARFI